MQYFDANYIVRLYAYESGWDQVTKLAATDQIACAWHGQAEVIAALHRKFRENLLQQQEWLYLLEQFQTDCETGAFYWLPLTPAILQNVRQQYSKLPANIFLRSADALHLGCAATQGLKIIYSHDQRLLNTAQYFGLQGKDVIE